MNLVRVKYYAIEKQSEIEFNLWLISVERIWSRALSIKRSISLVTLYIVSRLLKSAFKFVHLVLEEPALYRQVEPGSLPERVKLSEESKGQNLGWRAM